MFLIQKLVCFSELDSMPRLWLQHCALQVCLANTFFSGPKPWADYHCHLMLYSFHQMRTLVHIFLIGDQQSCILDQSNAIIHRKALLFCPWIQLRVSCFAIPMSLFSGSLFAHLKLLCLSPSLWWIAFLMHQSLLTDFLYHYMPRSRCSFVVPLLGHRRCRSWWCHWGQDPYGFYCYLYWTGKECCARQLLFDCCFPKQLNWGRNHLRDQVLLRP